ncbi:MAG: hypothetical protein J6A03_11075 [Lachnospiraceae bacterium]|nr:hypothetical protein [Lachnospiraceae bacterium]
MQHIRKRYYVGFLLGCVVLLMGCKGTNRLESEQGAVDIRITLDTTENDVKDKTTDLSRGDLFIMFEEMNNETVMDFQYGDYNKDGTHEAFVVTNSDGYKLWYMHPAGCELVEDNFEGKTIVTTDTLEFSTKKYLLLQQEIAGHPNTLVYTLDNKDQVVQPIVSGRGYLKEESGNHMVLRVYGDKDKADEYCDYYLYYNPDEGFKEYGGIPIVEEQFLEFQGSSDILEDIRELYGEYELDITYLYRSNQYMNINWSFYEEGKIQYRHATLQYDNEKVRVAGELDQKGRAEIADVLEIATFPTAFKHPDVRIDQ